MEEDSPQSGRGPHFKIFWSHKRGRNGLTPNAWNEEYFFGLWLVPIKRLREAI
jgi:hypothetical protein